MTKADDVAINVFDLKITVFGLGAASGLHSEGILHIADLRLSPTHMHLKLPLPRSPNRSNINCRNDKSMKRFIFMYEQSKPEIRYKVISSNGVGSLFLRNREDNILVRPIARPHSLSRQSTWQNNHFQSQRLIGHPGYRCRDFHARLFV